LEVERETDKTPLSSPKSVQLRRCPSSQQPASPPEKQTFGFSCAVEAVMAITVYEIALAFCKSFVSVLLLLLPPLHSTSAHLSFLLFFFSLPGRIVINLFFREIRPRGAYNIPRSGPVLFVGAPHQYIRLSLSRQQERKLME